MDVIDIALSKGIASTEVKKLENKILDKNGQIQGSLLPNYTEIPIEYDTREDFPLLGETGYIYIDKSTGRRYKWSGSIYIEIVADLILGETEFTAYRGDRGKIAYDHSQTEGNPHNTTTAQIGAVPKERTINGKSLEGNIEINAFDVGALSDKTTINGKLLSENVSLTAEDVGALSKDVEIPSLENYATKNYVDETVQNKNTELSNAVNTQIKSVSDKVDSFDSALKDKIDATEVDEKLSQLESKIPTDYVPLSRTINGKVLETDISLNAQDIGAEQEGAAEQMLQNAKSYADEKDELISSQISQHQEEVSAKISSIEQNIVNQEEQISNIDEAQALINTALNENKQKIQENSNKIQENLSAININSQKIGENTAGIEENSSQISQHKGETSQKFSSIDQSLEAQGNEINIIKGDLTSHTNSSNAQFSAVREEVATQDAETLKTAKEYSDANKESAVSSAKDYTDQKIDELVNGTGLEGVVDTIKDINEAMAESSDMMEALETANSKKVDKGAKGSTIKPIYFDENGAREIAYTIEKSVPADAKFTDTTYTLIKDATNKKIQLMNGDALVSEVDDNNTTYNPATQSAQGLLSAADKKKLDGIATSAEVNQNAFSNVVVGSTTIAADTKTDTLTIVAGSNITLTPDATNDKLTIAAKDTTYGAATTSAAGLMSAADKTKLDGIEDIIPTKTSQLTNDSSFVNQTGLNNALEDKLSFDEEVVNSTSDMGKVVPEGSGKYAAVNKVGSMSHKCKNLYENRGTTRTIYGVTFTVYTDGSVRVSGTATETAQLNLGTTTFPAGSYIVSGYKSDEHAELYVRVSTDSSWPLVFGEKTITLTEQANVFLLISVAKGRTVDAWFYPMIRKATETNATYQPYYGGIRNAATTSIKSIGANYCNSAIINKGTVGGITFSLGADGESTHIEGTSTANYPQLTADSYKKFYLPKGTYTMRMFKKNIVTDASVGFAVKDLSLKKQYTVGVNYATFTVTENNTEIGIFFFVNPPVGTIVNLDIYGQITRVEEDSETYIPYKENTLEIPEAIGELEGYGLGIDENLYNYIDWERKVFVKRVARVDLGTLEWSLMTGNRFISSKIENLKMAQSQAIPINAICDTYTTVKFDTLYAQSVDKTIGTPYDNNNIYIVDKAYTDATALKAALNGVHYIYELAYPEEIDISDYLPDDNFLEVAAGGVITAVNEYNYDVPTEISFFTSESPEKVIVADTFVGDLAGIAKEAQTLIGLDSTIEELNYLHKEIIEEEGWLIPESGEFDLDGMPGATGPLGLVVGNSYVFTLTYADGTVKTETITAIDASTEDSMWPVGTPMIQGYTYEGIVIFDKVLIDADFNVVVGNNYYWAPLSNIDSDLVSVKMTGKKADGSSITHQTETYNKIPLGYLPDGIGESPIKQYWEWTKSDAKTMENDLGFEKPDGYNRCRILIYERKFTSDGDLGVYMPIILPLARNKNSDTAWFDVEMTGRTLADVKLGRGEGENQTTGGTEWVSTVSIDVHFADKGFMCNYACGTELLSLKTVTAGTGYPETYAGQIGGVLSKDADVDSILDSSLVWTLGIFLQQNKGNYVEVTWFKD